jgi:hypothetical protein
MIDTDGKFFLGGSPDPKSPLLYDPDNLTTHAVVVGMTGSGKTGLCIDILEEAALNNIPALMIDPKGDITNALLHFTDLLPEDFQPWINPDEARRDGKSMEQAAQDTAGLWSKGHADWGIDRQRRAALKNSAHFAIFTPGSDAGIPVSILASLKAPELAWKGNEEALREKISGTVTAILGLVGMENIDPVRSREHILMANIFENAWSAGKDLDLGELILQVQNPPFEKLGVFDLNTFFAEKERFELAMTLNNILAAPSFQNWIKGTPLDIKALLFGPDGRPRHSVFYIAHLSDSERMFFVTLLYAAVETWMRAQKGSTSLRALVYFDEIFGYLPPTANPPSKPLMLRMLKQARAFGVGQMLVTQNPVDVDYKALSNAGTWFIGKLQTERDKERLLDGLEGAASGNMDRKKFDAAITKLGKREFLAHNVHEKAPTTFYTRWAMNYLAGPLTRTQIPALNALVGAAAESEEVAVKSKKQREPIAETTATLSNLQQVTADDVKASFGTATRAAVPGGIREYFLPNNLTVSEAITERELKMTSAVENKGLLYKPQLIAQADIRYSKTTYNLNHAVKRAVIVPDPDRRGVARWEEYEVEALDESKLLGGPAPEARFDVLEAPLTDASAIKAMERDFIEWLYRDGSVNVFHNPSLKLYAGPPATKGDFRKTLADEARKARDAEIAAVEKKYRVRIQAVQKKITREQRELSEGEADLGARKLEELGTHAENVLGFLTGSRSTTRISRSLTKRRLTAQAKADIDESQEVLEELNDELADLSEEIEAVVDEIEEKWGEAASVVEEIPVTPLKKDILTEIFGVAWVPHHIVVMDGRELELPGFAP